MRTAFEREGDIRSVDLLAAFATLWREGSSGVLRFSGGGESVRFDVLDGDLVHVTASDASFDAIEVLVRAGKLDRSALEGRRFPSGKDRALAAREMDLLTERDWRWGERIRAVEILAHLVAWLEGTYTFDPTVRPERGELSVGIHRLLLELFLRSRDRAFVHHALPAVDSRLQRSPDFDEKFAALGLTQDALAVAAAVDGRSTAAEISRRTPPDPFSVEKLLAALATLGLLHPEYAAEPPRAVAGREAEEPPPEEPPAPPPPPPAPVPEAPPLERLVPEHGEEPELDLPLSTPVEPAEPEPALVAWENTPAEPMDQRLDVAAGEIAPSSRRTVPGAVWVLLVLALAVGALLFTRARERGSGPLAPVHPAPAATPNAPNAVPATPPAAAIPVPPTAPPETATPIPPTPTPRPSPSSTAGTAVPTPVPPTPVPPTPVPPIPKPPTPAPSPRVLPTRPPPPTTAPSASGRGFAEWLARAERDRARLQRQPNALFTVQLELVCEIPSLEEAWRFDRRGAMWLASADHRGRPCFRVFWGRYRDLPSARRARESVPRFFFTPTNHPTVVSTRSALLP
jgi:uncharacterized protein DUF4388